MLIFYYALRFVCRECHISVVSKTSMQNHVQKVHNIEANFSAHILVDASKPDLEEWVR